MSEQNTSMAKSSASAQPLVPVKSALPWSVAIAFLLFLPVVFPSGAALTIMN